jgi:Ca-activated chloride channel family protein
MHFAHPELLWLAALVPPWLWLAWRRRAQGEARGWLLRHPQLAPAAWLAAPGLRAPLLLQALAFGLLVTALAQPRESGEAITPPPQGRDIALVIDSSLTMSLQDFDLQGKPVSRMAMLRQVLGDFVQARAHDRFALLVFGTQAALLTPPTFDQAHVLAQLQRLQVGVAGDDTALGDALGLALKPLRQAQLRPAIILVSDGEPSNSGELSPAEAVAVARQLGVAIHTLQIGSPNRPPVDVASAIKLEAYAQPGLADIARLSGGQHWTVRSSADAQAVMQAIDKLEPTLVRPSRARTVHEWYGVPLALAMTCLVLAQWLRIRRGSV